MQPSPSKPPIAPPACPLCVALRPVLPLFHSFLTDSDAAHLLRIRKAAVALLLGYAFTSHTFQPTSLASLRLLRDLCLTYCLLIRQVSLPADVKQLVVDPAPPHLSPIPPSVLALSLGSSGYQDEPEPSWAALSEAASGWPGTSLWRLPTPFNFTTQRIGEQEEREQRLRRWAAQPDEQLSDEWDHPLQPGVLPSSLLHLSLPERYRHRLGPGVLPASLESLSMTVGFRQPLTGVAWPPRLKALLLRGGEWPVEPLQPHSLPSSLLVLCLRDISIPLPVGVLPSSLVELRLGDAYNHHLPPGGLPASLRLLTLGSGFDHQLYVGSLSEGLQFLRFQSAHSWRGTGTLPALLPGSLPSTLPAST